MSFFISKRFSSNELLCPFWFECRPRFYLFGRGCQTVNGAFWPVPFKHSHRVVWPVCPNLPRSRCADFGSGKRLLGLDWVGGFSFSLGQKKFRPQAQGGSFQGKTGRNLAIYVDSQQKIRPIPFTPKGPMLVRQLQDSPQRV